MVRVAILSFWHVHAEDYAREAAVHADADIVAVWDADSARGEVAAARWGAPFVARLDEVLARPDIDGVVVTTPTVAHRDVLIAAARAGKHIYVEKVIAPTLRETREIVAAIDAAGVTSMVSLPRRYAGYTRAIEAVLAEGTLGPLSYARVRVSHNGAVPGPGQPVGWLPDHFFDPADAAGGALIDFGCHPIYLTRLMLGMPESVSASYGRVTGRVVEDHASVALRYAGGAVGVAEVSFLGRGLPFVIEAHGSAGSLIFGPPDDRLRLRTSARDAEWVVREPLPPDLPSPFAQWINHVQAGTTAPDNIAIAVDLGAIVEAANRSAAENRPVRLDELA